jgi:methionyl-tRNA synthetase
VVGKDIMRFHCIYWPAFLLAAGLALPEQILIHGHFMVEGRKMSKSLGNVLDPKKLLREPDPDAKGAAWLPPVDSVRWALLARGCLGGDGDFSREQLESLWSSHIADGVGNLAARATGKALLPEPSIPDPRPGWHADTDGACLSRVAGLGSEALQHFEGLRMSHATSSINEASTHLNAYFTAREPWKLAPGKPGADADRLAAVLFTTLEGLRILGVAMQPAIPHSAAALLDALAVPTARRASCAVWLPCHSSPSPDAWLFDRVGTTLQLNSAHARGNHRKPLVLFSKPLLSKPKA